MSLQASKPNKLNITFLISFVFTICFTSTPIFAEDINQSNPANPICYLRNSNGDLFDLSKLCKGEPQKISNIRNVGNTTLKIGIFKRFIRINNTKRTSFYAGNLINNTNEIQTGLIINYRTYRLKNGVLVKSKLKQFELTNSVVLAQDSVIFSTDENRRGAYLLVIESIYSEESGLIPQNICYANTVERREYCRKLSIASIKEYPVKRLRD